MREIMVKARTRFSATQHGKEREKGGLWLSKIESQSKY